VSCLLHFDGRALTFADGGDGTRKVTVDLVLVLLDEYGVMVASDARTYDLKLTEQGYRATLRDGIDYTQVFPVKRAGHYQVRAAIRDAASDRVGSDFEPVDVPNLKKGRLELSALALGGRGGVTVTDTAVRRFRRGEEVLYGFDVYNARLDAAAKAPRLQIAIRLYREGEPVYTGEARPLELPPQPDWRRVRAGGALALGAEMRPGSYVLEVTVTDPLSKKKPSFATRWVDFDVE
jgi:hypothetical protein